MMGAGLTGVVLLALAVGTWMGRRFFLERVRQQVQQRLVAVLPGAQLGRLQLVGGLQLKVVGSVLPLTDGLTLVLADVVVDGLLAAVRTGPAALRVKHAQGTLSGPWIQTVVVDLAFEAGQQTTQVLDGVLRATFPGGDGQPVTLRGVVTAGLEGARAQVESLQEVALPFVLKATAQAQEQWELAVQADFVDTAVQGLAQVAQSLLAARLPALPPLLLGGSVAWRQRSGGSVDLTVHGDGVKGQVQGALTPDGMLERTRLQASADAEKLVGLFGLQLSPSLALGSTVTLEGSATGFWRHPTLQAQSKGLTVTWRPDDAQLVVLEDVALDVEGVVHALKARATASLAGIPLNANGTLHPWPRPESNNAMLVLETEPMDAGLLGLVLAVVRGGGVPSTALPLPPDATVALELTVEHDGRGSGRVHVRSGASHVTVEPQWQNLSTGLVAQVIGKVELDKVLPTPWLVGRADVDARVEWTSGVWRVEGWCGAPALLVAVPGMARGLALEQVRGELKATATDVELTTFQASLAGGQVNGHGVLHLGAPADGERARISLAPLPPEAVAGLLQLIPDFRVVHVEKARQARALEEIWIPADATLAVELTARVDGAFGAALVLHTPRSDVTAQLQRNTDGKLQGTVGGRLAFADALSLGMFTAAVRPAPMGHVQLDAQVTGTLAAPCISGTGEAKEAALQLSDSTAFPRPEFQGVQTQFSVDLVQTRWSVTAQRAYGGSAKAGGLVGYGGAFVGLRTTVDLEGINVAKVPTQLDGTAQLDGLLGGHLTAHLQFNRQGPPGAVLTAQGEVRLDDPEFPVVSHAKTALGRFGLSPPPGGGTRPVLCTVALTGNTLRLNGLEAGLHGVEAQGNVAVNVDSGVLDGAIKATLDSDYLSQSTLLSFPAVMNGRVTIPIHVRGTLQHPDVGADTAAVLGQFVTGNIVVRGVTDAISDLAGAFGFGSGSGRGKQPTQEDVDRESRRYDHVLKNDKDDDDDFLQKLLDSGMSADEIASVLGRRPKGR